MLQMSMSSGTRLRSGGAACKGFTITITLELSLKSIVKVLNLHSNIRKDLEIKVRLNYELNVVEL